MNNLQVTADKAAMALSIACALHCLLLPVALIALPAIASLPLADESFHQMLLMGVLPVSLLAVLLGCRQHRSAGVAGTCLLGLGLLLVAALLGHDLFGERGEKILTVLGSVVVVCGHIQNYRRCQQC